MVKISDIIEETLKNQGRSKKWLSEQIKDINYKAFLDRLSRDSFTAYQLIEIATILNIDLEKLKNEELN